MAKRKPAKGEAVGPTLREQWDDAFRTWRDLLPRRVVYGPRGSGKWHFQLETDEQKLAAGWTPAKGFVRQSDGVMKEVDMPQPNPKTATAAWVLADIAKRLADRAAQLRVNGSRELREFERELRWSAGFMRNPLLLWEDGLEYVVADVLAAHEGDSVARSPSPSKPGRSAQRALDEEGMFVLGLLVPHYPNAVKVADLLARATPRLSAERAMRKKLAELRALRPPLCAKADASGYHLATKAGVRRYQQRETGQ